MANSHVHHRSTYVWLWIILGIIVVIALIWWAGGTGTQPATTGAGTADTVQSDNYNQPAVTNPAQPGAVDQSGNSSANPGAAGAAAPADTSAQPANAPAMPDNAPAMSDSNSSQGGGAND
jgi:hypothetical protein